MKIAVAGIGGYGGFYLNELLNAGPEREVQFVAGIDPYAERCPQIDDLRAAGVAIYPDLETFFHHDTADLVIISAPIHQHAPLTCLALERGAHVLCEKPLAGSLDDARRMLAAERSTGRQVAIGYQWSFCDPILALKRDVLAGRFGRPLSLKTLTLWPRRHSYFHRNDWAARIYMDDGTPVLDSPVNNATAHYLHNMLFLLGETLETSAQPLSLEAELYRANRVENYDTAALRVHSAAGADLLFLTTHAVPDLLGPVLHYEFEDAVIEYPNEDGEFIARFRDGRVENYGNPIESEANKLWMTVEAARSGNPAVCGIQTALLQLFCTLGAQETPITDFPPAFVREEDLGGDALTWVDGLFETFRDCYERNELPSDSRPKEWVRPAVKVDLTKYGVEDTSPPAPSPSNGEGEL